MKLADLLRFLATFPLALLTVRQLKLLLLDWFNCNWEIMSAGCSGFVCWRPTSLLPALSTFPGIYTCPLGSTQLHLRQHAIFVGEKGVANQDVGPALRVHLA